MGPLFTAVLLVPGFIFLVKGADYLVGGASGIAQKLKIPGIIIGLTIVAFGTSMPELVVSMMASIKGSGDIAVANVLGSNAANILLILGLSAAISPLIMKKATLWKEIPFSMLALAAMYIMLKDGASLDGGYGALSQTDGLILLALFAGFLVYIFRMARSYGPEKIDTPSEILGMRKASFLVVVGLAGLIVGGNWIVNGAIMIASALGLSQTLIGLTVVAVGTSLPELATSVVASLKNRDDIAVGNVVGSNIFNILLVAGLSSAVRPLGYSGGAFDFLAVAIATIALFALVLFSRKKTLGRAGGFALLSLYAGYIAVLAVSAK